MTKEKLPKKRKRHVYGMRYAGLSPKCIEDFALRPKELVVFESRGDMLDWASRQNLTLNFEDGGGYRVPLYQLEADQIFTRRYVYKKVYEYEQAKLAPAKRERALVVREKVHKIINRQWLQKERIKL